MPTDGILESIIQDHERVKILEAIIASEHTKQVSFLKKRVCLLSKRLIERVCRKDEIDVIEF